MIEPRPAGDRLIALREVEHRAGIKKSKIYSAMASGTFPRSRSLGPRCVRWSEREIDAWVAAPTTAPGHAVGQRPA